MREQVHFMTVRKITGLATAMALGLLISLPALASLSQGFATAAPIATGSLVSLDPKSSGSVLVADLNNVGRLFGVAVAPSTASISISGSGTGQVQVTTSGTATVLVATSGGAIHVGDYITVSPIAGVGQKATAAGARVVGTAAADFTGIGDGSTKRTIDSGSGKTEVSIGEIPVVIAISSYSDTQGKQSYVVPNWLQNLSNTLAGKAVSPVRIILASLILVVAVISVSVLLYSAVRNSIISIGRNPLSHSSVLKGMLVVSAISAGILAMTSFAMYIVIAR